MINFTYSIPTKIHFGKGQISHLTELADYGKKVLLVYGGGSIKKLGIYDEALRLLNEAGLTVYECAGVEPNPKVQSARAGIETCRANGIDMVLAIGGGSVIDCAKLIAAGVCYEGDAWDLVIDSRKLKKALPIFTVLTLAATGSEMDGIAVISDLEKRIKVGTRGECLKPVMSILDPTYTFSTPTRQTAAGTADIMSHVFENYFTPVEQADVQARFCEGLLKTCIKYGPVALAEPENYNARANLMWSSSMAINGLLSNGAYVPWCVHPMEHELSAFYDIVHGEGLAILIPHWMDHVLNEQTAAKFAQYGRNVWELTGKDEMAVAKQAIQCTRDFFRQMGLPATLREVGIDETWFEAMAQKAAPACAKSYVPLSAEDIQKIFMAAR